MPSGSSAATKDGRWKRSVTRLAIRPSRPLCQPSAPRKRRGDLGAAASVGFGAGEGILEHALLDRLPLGVQRFEPLGDGARLDVVVGGEQLRAEARSADASASVDARAEDEAERIGGGRRIDARDIRERAQARIMPEPQHFETLGDESAVRLLERHHVAHRGERNEIEQAKQVGLGAIAIEALAPENAGGRHEEQENDPCGGEMPLFGEIVVTVRIDDGERARESLVRLVMIDDDHLGACRVGSIDRRAGRRAAIEGEDQARAFLREPAQRILARAISFGQPVGDVGQRRSGRGRGGSARSERRRPRRRHRSRRTRQSSPLA